MILSRNMLKRVGESRYPCRNPIVSRNDSPYAAVEEDCTSGQVIEVFGGSDTVGTDVGLFMSPQKAAYLSKAILKSIKTR